MKFDDKYPNEKTGFSEPLHEDRLYKSGRLYQCDTGSGGCGQLTDWRDTMLGYEVPVCSEECLDAQDETSLEAAGALLGPLTDVLADAGLEAVRAGLDPEVVLEQGWEAAARAAEDALADASSR